MLDRRIFFVLFFLLCPIIMPADNSVVFDYQMSDETYTHAVDALFDAFKKLHPVAPGKTGLIALRVHTSSGPGLCTPQELVLAINDYLIKSGFKRGNILIVGDSENTLRECGYLPKLSQQKHYGSTFNDMPVFWITDEQFHKENWVYSISLASDRIFRRAKHWSVNDTFGGLVDYRDSYLPTLLMFGVDWWIDLPICVGSYEHGVIGGLIQGSVFNVSNHKRFLANPANCALAAAQIAALPELKNKHLCTIVSLKRFQYNDSLIYNENYVRSLPHVLLSDDPVALDNFCLSLINDVKSCYGVRFLHDKPIIFRYSEELGVGNTQFTVVKVKRD